MALFASTIGLSAFLLFLVQPIIARQILPWFGGSAAVWTTCMVFFQVVLLAGYFYADRLIRHLDARWQMRVHLALLVASLTMLPITAGAELAPTDAANPIGRILSLLALTIGLPYLMLATTAPLVQAWFVRRRAGGAGAASVWRLYALSNAASMAALLAYPSLIEPLASGRAQSLGWSAAYAVFVVLAAGCAWQASQARPAAPQPVSSDGATAATAAPPPPTPVAQLLWLALAALGSVLLLATTTHLTQNVASVPFLWVLPLALYLTSFILTFDGSRWMRPGLFRLLACVMSVVMMAGLVWRPNLDWTTASPWTELLEKGLLTLHLAVPLYAAGLFVLCLFAHGELVARRPSPLHLTRFYLMVSLGGAIGGLLVGIAAPLMFNGYWEMPGALIAVPAAALVLSGWRFKPLAAAALAACLWIGWVHLATLRDTTIEMSRNFYGTLRVKASPEGERPDVVRRLLHGVIEHGHQRRDEADRRKPTSYYGHGSGVAQALMTLREFEPGRAQRIGLIGLGVGTLAAYGRPGDVMRFYELDPSVLQLAQRHFSYLADSAARVETVLGDARLALGREPPQEFDLLAVDAFSSDSIPVHLITQQALAVYRRHLRHGGVVAFHVSNRYLLLAPVVAAVARQQGLRAWQVTDDPSADPSLYESDWVLVTANAALLDRLQRRGKGQALVPAPEVRAWTDDHHNLFEVLR